MRILWFPPLGSVHASLTPTHFFTALAPMVGSIAIRPKFQPYLTNKTRKFSYFLITAFLPTIMGLRWHRVAWKISLPASLVLSVATKHLSDRWITRSPFEPPKKPSHTETPLPKLQLVPLQVQHTLASPTPSSLFKTISDSTIENVLQLVLPGEYTVSVSHEGNVTLSDPKVEKDVKAWIGKKEEGPLTREEVASLHVYVRYRSCSPEQRVALRQNLFATLAPLLEGKDEVTIPWMTGYSGESLSLAQSQDGTIILEGQRHSTSDWSLLIYSNGHCKYVDHYITIENEDRETLRPTQKNHQIRTDFSGREGWAKLEGEWVHEFDERGVWKTQLTTTKEHLNTGPAHLELLFFKLDQVQAFLQGEPTRQAEQVFANCCDLLGTLASEAESQAVVPHKEEAAVVPLKESPVDTTSYILGPIWSPVANSEDSTFNWIVTRSSSGQTTLQLQKKSSGRGMMGGTAERTVTLKTLELNKLELEIYKAGANDLETYASFSVYHLEKTSEGVRVTPQGRECTDHCISFILGMQEFYRKQSGIQSLAEMQADGDFMLKVLTTIADIKMSPDTMLIDSNNRLVNLQGRSVPTDRVKLLSSQRQGAMGYPAIYYHAERQVVSGPESRPLLTGAPQPRAIEDAPLF